MSSMPAPKLSSAELRGFTLVELLVAIVVFALLLVILLQIISFTTKATGTVSRASRSLNKARAALDTFGQDWSRGIRRSDVAFHLGATNGAPMLQFYTARQTANSPRGISLILYTGTAGLCRAAAGVEWTSTGSVSLGFSGTSPAVFSGITPLAEEPVCDDMLKWDVCYVDRSTRNVSRVLDNPARIGAVMITLAVLDEEYRRLLSMEQLADLKSRLPTPPSDASAGALWQNAVNRPDFATGLPLEAASHVQIVERTFPCP